MNQQHKHTNQLLHTIDETDENTICDSILHSHVEIATIEAPPPLTRVKNNGHA
jgi:hypothetical protein